MRLPSPKGEALHLEDAVPTYICLGVHNYISDVFVQVEKGLAEEQARQAERQAQDLMEERAKIKAEKEQLERSHNEMAARVELLEGIISETGALSGDEESVSCLSEGPERISSPEVQSQT